MLQCSFSAAQVQLLREVRIFWTGACGWPERKHPEYLIILKIFLHISCFLQIFFAGYIISYLIILIIDFCDYEKEKNFRRNLFVMIRIPYVNSLGLPVESKYCPERLIDLIASLAKYLMICRDQISETVTNESIFNSKNSHSSVFSSFSIMRVENEQKLMLLSA